MPDSDDPSPTDELCRALRVCGFDARSWRGQRIYIRGYGRDIKAWLSGEPDTTGILPADAWRLAVTSSWRAALQNGLRCKGVKHAILSDLHVAGLISVEPPARWQDVVLDAPHAVRSPITRYEGGCVVASPADVMRFPERRPRDPYAALRAFHRSDA